MQKKSLNSKNNKFLLLFLLVFLCIALTGNVFASVSTSNHAVPLTLYQDNYDGSRTLLHHKPIEINSSKRLSSVEPNKILNFSIIMPFQNQSQLNSLLENIYTPGNPAYHHFLTPEQFAQDFGPPDTDTQQVKEFLIAQGFSVTGQSPNKFVLKVAGRASSVQKAFRLNLNYYQKSDGTLFYAPDADPTVPINVADKISSIDNLDNVTKFIPAIQKVSVNSKISAKVQIFPNIGTGYGCPAYLGWCLAPGDMTKLYNLNGLSSNGSGQNVALFELDGYLPSDIVYFLNYYGFSSTITNDIGNPCNYASTTPGTAINFNLNNPSVPCSSNILQNILMDGVSGVAGSDTVEVTSDIEILEGTTSGLSNIFVYEAPNSTQGWEDEWTQIATDDVAKVVSCSWGIAETYSTSIAFDIQNFEEMAAQGQEVFVATGDSGAFADGVDLSVQEPAAQPYVTGVGATLLQYLNSDGTYSPLNGAEISALISGGGISWFQPIPSYQQGAITVASDASTTMRNVPDIALNGGGDSPYSFYVTNDGGWLGVYGTSIAAPQWAGFNARVNQGRISAGEGPIGFINPVLYTIAQNAAAYSNDFHDITQGNNSYYDAVAGYDLTTGLGSYNGANLFNDLVFSPPVDISASATGSSITLTWPTNSGALSYNIYRATASGREGLTPYGTVSNANPVVSYTDDSVTAGTVYYYVVSAIYTGGKQSSNSLEVSSQPGPTQNVTINVGANGTVRYDGATINSPQTITVNNWSSPVFTITAAPNYEINQITVGGIAVTIPNPMSLNPNTYTFTLNNVTAAKTVAITFTLIPYTITPSVSNNQGVPTTAEGSIYPSGPVTVFSGSSQTFTITLNPSWWPYYLLIDGQTYVTPNPTANPNVFTYTFNNVTANHTIQAVFATYFTIVSSATPSYSDCPLTPNGTENYISGTDLQFSITLPPSSPYSLVQLIIDGNPVSGLQSPTYHIGYSYGDSLYVFANHTIQAVCSLPTNLITASAGTGGSISPSGSVSVNAGINQTFNISPNSGYYNSQVLIDGAPVTPPLSSYTFNVVAAAHTIAASFEPTVNGVCGTAARTYLYGTNGFGNDTLCKAGTPDPTDVPFPAAGQSVSWNCLGTNGVGLNSSCTAKQNAWPIVKL